MATLVDKFKKFVDTRDERKAKRLERKSKFNESLVQTLQTTTKQLIWWFTIHGTVWIYCSYILAFTDHVAIAETLSSNVCTVVIGSMGMYVISKTVENVFKYNSVGGASNQKVLEREGTADPGTVADINGVPVIDMTDGIETNGVPESQPDTDPASGADPDMDPGPVINVDPSALY